MDCRCRKVESMSCNRRRQKGSFNPTMKFILWIPTKKKWKWIRGILQLHVALYYESLCPDCQFFATKQLKPIYEEIKNHVELLLVPFGKSESENHHFYCQHGPAECTGNRIQSCVLDAVNYEQDASVRFVDCQMQSNADFSGKEVLYRNYCYKNRVNLFANV